MKTLKMIDYAVTIKEETKHLRLRSERIKKYRSLLSLAMLYCFRVDNNHANGDEIHCINKYGLIYIYNYNTKKFITILHPRPKQLKRYFHQLNIKLPQDIKILIDKCYKRNTNSNMNEL